MTAKSYIAAFFCILLLPGRLLAQSAELHELSILISVQEEDDSTAGLLKGVIDDSLALEFLLNDFKVGFSGISSGDILFAEAEERKIPYILVGSYRIIEDQVSVQLECLRTDNRAFLYSGQEEFPVNLNLDNAIQKQVRGIIAIIQKDAIENPPSMSVEEPVEDRDPIAEELVTEELEPSGKKLIITGEFGFFIPLGESSDYFDPGYIPSLSAVYPLSLPFGTLELGVSLSLNIIHAEGRLNSSQNLLLFFAPLAQYRIPMVGDFSAYLRLAAGGTLLMVNRNNEGYQGVLIPSFQTGLGGEYALGENFGFRLGADFSMTFEQSITITGIQPSLGVYYRL